MLIVLFALVRYLLFATSAPCLHHRQGKSRTRWGTALGSKGRKGLMHYAQSPHRLQIVVTTQLSALRECDGEL